MIRLAPSPRPPIGVDFDGRYITAAQLARSTRGRQLETTVRLERMRPAAEIDHQAVRHLCEVLARQGFKGGSVVLAVPAEKLLTGVLELPPRSSGAPLEEIARAELARMHDYDPASVETACWDLPASTRSKDVTQVMAMACRHADSEALLGVFESAGLKLAAMESHPHALVRACRPLLAGEGIAGILDISWDRALLILTYQGVVVYERIMADAGTGKLSESVSERLGLAADSVDYLLAEVGLAPPTEAAAEDAASFDAVMGVIRAHVDAICAELASPFSYAAGQYPGAAADGLLLTGHGAGIAGLPEYLRSRLEMPIRRVRPPDLVQCPPALGGRSDDPALTVALGLAEYPG